MALTEHLRKQHADLVAVITAIAPLLHKPERCAAEIRSRLSILADKLIAHLALEDDILYSILARHAEPHVRELGRQFTTEMSGLKPAFVAFNTRWSESEIGASPTVFSAEARKIFGVIENRIARENKQLYPVADGAAMAAPLCATR